MSSDALAVATGPTPISQRAARTIVRRAMSGTVWLLAASAAARLMTFGTSIVLARLLGPSDFGLVSFAMVAIGAISLLQDLGVPAALIYGGQSAREAAGTALTINVVSAVLLWVLLVAASPMFASIGGRPEIQGIVMVLGLGLIITSLGSVQLALLTRALAFRKRLVPDLVPLVVSGVTSIMLAFNGFGAWSLVWGYVSRSVAATATLWLIADIRFRPAFDRAVARRLLGYGKHVSASSIVGFAVNNVDYLIIGAVLGSYSLGLYTMAFVLGNLIAVFTQVMADVAFPTLSLLKEDRARLLRVFDRGVTLISMVLGYLLLGMVLLTPSFVPLLLGDAWAAVVQPLMILTVFSAIRSLGILYAPAFKALGRPDLVWKFALVRLAVATPSLYWAATQSIVTVAVVQTVLVAAYLPLHWILLRRLAGPLHRPQRLLLPPLVGLAVAAVIVAAISEAGAPGRLLAEPMPAVVMTVVLSAVYWLVIAAVRPDVVMEGYGRLRQMRDARRDGAQRCADAPFSPSSAKG